MDLFNRFRVYHKNVNWFVFLFISLFTIGSWIDINGKQINVTCGHYMRMLKLDFFKFLKACGVNCQ